MPVPSLYQQDPSILKKVCAIRDYMKTKQIERLFQYKKECDYVSIMFNTTPSPDGAMGMFLLLERKKLSLTPNDPIEELLIFKTNISHIEEEIKKKQQTFSNMYGQRQRLQEYFEFYTYLILESCNLNPTPPVNINDYDFLININGNNIAIEVKSDKWIETGNLALELLRNYEVEDCKNNIKNMGSILKSKADYWQEYFYNEKTREVETEIYKLTVLQFHTKKTIDCLIQKLKITI